MLGNPYYSQVFHTKQDGGLLDNLYSLQVLHTKKDGVVLGNTIQDSQLGITLRECRMIFHM